MFPLFTTRCLHVRHDVRDPSGGSGKLWARMLSGNFAEMTTSTPFRDLLHAANLRHGTDGFTSPPKEGVLRIFSPLKIRQLRPGLNPRTWVLKASTTEAAFLYASKNYFQWSQTASSLTYYTIHWSFRWTCANALQIHHQHMLKI